MPEHKYNIVVESEQIRSHHEQAPGEWMPRARVFVDDDPILHAIGMEYVSRAPLLAFHEEDLMPHELVWVRRVKQRRKEE